MKRNINATTKSQEQARQTTQSMHRSVDQGLRRAFGEITSVLPGKGMVKVRLDGGHMAAGGAYLRVITPPKDITLRWGTLRAGLKVIVNYTGDVETDGYIDVIGDEEDQSPGTAPLLDNNVTKGLYQIFTPGNGVF